MLEIHITNLCKQYSPHADMALDNINLAIKPGILGLVGENGAGKTSLIKILATMLPMTKGEVMIGHYSLPKDETNVRAYIGYLPQNYDFFGALTVFDSMEFVATLKGVPSSVREAELPRLLEDVHLLNKRNVKVKHLSGGMKQRLGIAQCLIGNPRIIILDEPTVGLDPTERLSFRNLITRYAVGRIVILSSHIINDISMLCSNVVIMKKGRILYAGSTNQLIKSMDGKIFTQTLAENEQIDQSLHQNIISVTQKESGIEVRIFSDQPYDKKCAMEAEPSLEDAYFYTISGHDGLI